MGALSVRSRRVASDTAVTPGKPLRVGLAVLAAGLALTLFAYVRVAADEREDVQRELQMRAERMDSAVHRRMLRMQAMLKAARAAHVTLGGFDRGRFRTYIGALDREHALQGMRGIGFIERVMRGEVDAFVERQRSDEAPGFRIDTKGDAEDLFVVRFVEPIERNRNGLGYDIGSEASRRGTVMNAVQNGDTAISAPLRLVRDGTAAQGWLMMVPAFRPWLPQGTAEERLRALDGLFYARVTAEDLARELSMPLGEQDGYEIFDDGADGGLLFSTLGAAARPPGSAVAARQFDFGGRHLGVRVWGPAMPPGWRTAWSVALACLALSVLAALGAAHLARARESVAARQRREQADLERMQELMHRTDVLAIGLDDRLRVRWINPGFTLLTGWTDEDCVGRSTGRWLQPVKGQPLLAQAAVRLRHGAPQAQLELVHRCKDGQTCYLEALLQPDDAGGFTLRANDITGRRLAEQRLAESEHQLRMVTDNVPVRLSYWSIDRRCLLVNRAMAVAAQRPAEVLLGKSVREVLGRAGEEVFSPYIDRVMTGEPQRFEWKIDRPDGTSAVLLVELIPDWFEGASRGTFSMAVDITALKAAQEQAQRASEAKTQFLSHMSHEIRTPMNAILGMLTLLRGSELDGRQADYARKAESAARSLLGLLNDILDLSKIEAGRMVLDPAPFRPDVLLHDLKSILAGAAHGKELDLRVDLDPALPAVLVGDDLRLRQVLVNLGGNAVKFTRAGFVAVRARLLGRDQEGVRVSIEVEDTGIGIAPEDKDRVFADFSQANSSTTREFGGTGLGLGICRRLIAMMGGELQLDSEPGRGSRFHFDLVLPEAPAGAALPLPRQTATGATGVAMPLKGLRLLVVEDNPVNQQVARELLGGEGAEITLASDGGEGVRAIQSAPGGFDAVLMDMQMPVMDGCTATREIRERLGDRTTPIIAMTANAMTSDRERCLAAGMNDHVAKPFELAELVAVLRRHTRRDEPPAEEPVVLAFDLDDAAPVPSRAPAVQPPVAATPAPAAAPTGDAWWDRAEALRRVGGDPKLLAHVLPVFIQQLRALSGQLRAPGDTDVAPLFHTIKGMAGTLGAGELSRRAAHAEHAAKAGEDGVSLAVGVCEAIDGTLSALEGAAKA